ncbi:rCG63127 [Rattus norvegicus]|uniref:RCG63127 n=1 Tax=Rattus norvegicus TaxID=10116 RepID=A6KLE8_RAT|nr:rCG63127 [Rattus norvegicus]
MSSWDLRGTLSLEAWEFALILVSAQPWSRLCLEFPLLLLLLKWTHWALGMGTESSRQHSKSQLEDSFLGTGDPGGKFVR